MMKHICIPFFNGHPVSVCEDFVLHPEKIDVKFETDSNILAKQMCGLNDDATIDDP